MYKNKKHRNIVKKEDKKYKWLPRYPGYKLREKKEEKCQWDNMTCNYFILFILFWAVLLVICLNSWIVEW